jgi:hypothetical protein
MDKQRRKANRMRRDQSCFIPAVVVLFILVVGIFCMYKIMTQDNSAPLVQTEVAPMPYTPTFLPPPEVAVEETTNNLMVASGEVTITTSMKPNFSDNPKIGESNRISFGK